MTVFPLSVGTFFISRSETSLKEAAVDRISSSSSLVRSSMPRRSFLLSRMQIHPLLLRAVSGRDGDHDLVHAVGLAEMYLDALLAGGREVLADVICLYRQLPVSPVNEHGKLNGQRPAEVHKGVHGGPGGGPGKEHIVDHNDLLAVDRRYLHPFERRLVFFYAEVVPVEGRVNSPDGETDAFDLLDLFPEPQCEMVAPCRDTENNKVFRSLVPLDYLVGDPCQSPFYGLIVEYYFFHGQKNTPAPFWTRRHEVFSKCRFKSLPRFLSLRI